MSCHYSVEIKFPPKVKQCFTRHLQTRYCTDCDKENTILFRSQKYGKMYFLIRCSLYVFYLHLKKSIQRIQSHDLCCYNTQRFFDGPGTYVYSCFRHCFSCKVKLLCFQMVVKLDAFFTHWFHRKCQRREQWFTIDELHQQVPCTMLMIALRQSSTWEETSKFRQKEMTPHLWHHTS